MSYDFPGASYDHWKTTEPAWHMPSWMRPSDEDLARYDRRRYIEHLEDGSDESLYEFMLEEEEELDRLEAHAREPEEEDFE